MTRVAHLVGEHLLRALRERERAQNEQRTADGEEKSRSGSPELRPFAYNATFRSTCTRDGAISSPLDVLRLWRTTVPPPSPGGTTMLTLLRNGPLIGSRLYCADSERYVSERRYAGTRDYGVHAENAVRKLVGACRKLPARKCTQNWARRRRKEARVSFSTNAQSKVNRVM